MNDHAGNARALHALLIGIDYYFPNLLPSSVTYPGLNGCVRDVAHVEDFLVGTLSVPADQVTKLTASHGDGSGPLEAAEQWPTYENMVVALNALADRATAGDHVYIHYSGHGGRSPTIIPDVKGETSLDESLVPTNIGDSEARYLRDVEMAVLLKRLVDKGLNVFIVLDSCHSGGATRGSAGAVVRGSNQVDTHRRPQESLVAAPEQLAAAWTERQTPSAARGLTVGSGWLRAPEGYVLLAACRPSESAYEYPFNGRECSGALTYWMLDALKALGRDLTYKRLHDRIVAKVHSQFERQTPQLEGDGGLVVLGTEHAAPVYAVGVIQADADGGRILLNTGQAQGVRKGAVFGVYETGTTDLTKIDKRLVLVHLDEVGATESWGTTTDRVRPGTIDGGSQAVQLDPGNVTLQRTVRVVRTDGAITELDPVKQALTASGGGWVRLVEDGPADYQVALGAVGAYEIWDPAGEEILLRPPIGAGSPSAVNQLLARLTHLTKYRNILELNNHDPMSPLAGKLVVELAGSQDDYDPADRPDPQPFADPGGTPVLDVGTWAFLRIRNGSPDVLNVAVLDLQPDWGITQIYPPQKDTDFMPLDPGQALLLPMMASLPEGYLKGVDVLKVIGSVGTASFRWLELPVLDTPLMRREGEQARHLKTGLDQLLAAFKAEVPKARNLNPAAYPSGEWVSAEVVVTVAAQ